MLDPSEDAFDSVHVGVGLGSSVGGEVAFLKNDPQKSQKKSPISQAILHRLLENVCKWWL